MFGQSQNFIKLIMQQQPIKTLFLQSPVCNNYNKALSICINETCQNSAFTCSRQNCGCIKNHQHCKKASLPQIMVKIQQKNKIQIAKVSQQLDMIIRIYDEIIEQFSQDRANFTRLSQQFGIQEKSLGLVNLLNEGRFNQINGKIGFDVYNQLSTNKKMQITAFPNKSVIEENRQTIMTNFNLIRKILRIYHNRCLPVGLRLESDIIDNKTFKKIKQYFIRPISNFQLLYRGSENSFSPFKFHQKCDGISNTLVLAQSQNNNIVGAYTPLRWRSPDFPAYTYDSSGQSFLFSLTANVKQSLYKQKHTIMNDKNQGPIFGKEKVFKIANKGKQVICQCSINQISQRSSFYTLKQYEVFRVLWQL